MHSLRGKSALVLLATCSAAVSAQSIGWRAPTYGAQAAIAGETHQSLAFDSAGGLYTLDAIADSLLTGGRLKHFDVGSGALLWQVDLRSVYPPPSGMNETIGVAPLGADAVAITLDYDTDYHGAISRYRGSDGALLWRSVDPHAGVAFDAIATASTGAAVAAGTSLGWPLNAQHGYVTKYDGDGALLWSADVDPSICGAGPSAYVLSGVAVDANGDVLAAGAPAHDSHVVVCVVKLRGDTGERIWAAGYASPTAIAAAHADMRVDAQGNPLVSASYYGSGFASSAAVVRFDGNSGAQIWAVDPVVQQGNHVMWLSLAAGADGSAFASSLTTQAFAAGDGHLLWPADAPQAGNLAIASDGTVLVGANSATNPYVSSGRHFTYSALNPADGSLHWSTDLPVDTVEYWDGASPLLASDAAGRFAALQSQSELCCTRQTLVAVGGAGTGTIAWSHADPDAGPGKAWLGLEGDTFSHTRSSVLTSDGGIVTSGITTIWYSSAYDQSGRLLTTKRSQHDGHLIWSQQADIGANYCSRGGIAIDHNGDIFVGGSCDTTPFVIKYRGTDGHELWQATPADSCTRAIVEALAVDVAGDAYASGICDSASGEDLVAFKLAGASGAVSWLQHAPGTWYPPSDWGAQVPPQMGLSSAGIYLAANLPPDANNYMGISVSELRPSDGHVNWTHTLIAQTQYSIQALVPLPSGDVVVSAGGIVARLAAATGNVVWNDSDVPGCMATAVDAAGNVLLACGSYVGKIAASSGGVIWQRNLETPLGYVKWIYDVALAADGGVLVTGRLPGASFGGTGILYVAQLGSGTGQPQWEVTDTSGIESGGVGVLPAADGSVIVTAMDEYSPPWWTLRIVTPGTDDLFANGMEP